MTPVSGLAPAPVSDRTAGDTAESKKAKAQPSSGNTEDRKFNTLIGDYLQRADDIGISDEQRDALKSSMEEMDESEVHGFLAMLQSQADWSLQSLNNADKGGNSALTDPAAVQKNPINGLPAQSSPAGATGAVSSLPLNTVMDKALTNYLPATAKVIAGDTSDKESFRYLNRGLAQSATRNDIAEQKNIHQSHVAESQQCHQDFIALKMTNPSEGRASSESVQSRVEGLVLSDTRPEVLAIPVRVTAETVRTEAINDVRFPGMSTTLVRQDMNAARNWSDAMGSRLVAMISEGRQEANIRLDPPELGTMGVRLVVQPHGVSVQFSSDIPQVRELLEAQADQLRDAMSQQGLNLTDVDVGKDQSGHQQQKQLLADRYAGMPTAMDETGAAELVAMPVMLSGDSLIDTFA